MAATPFEHAEQARLALRAIVAEHGPEILSRPAALSNLLSDLLPESPRIAKILVAAAQDQIANELREHTSIGMDTRTASRLAASSFADATMFAPEACAWVVDEFAGALGLTSDPGAIAAASPPMTGGVAGFDQAACLQSTEPASPSDIPDGRAGHGAGAATPSGRVRGQAVAAAVAAPQQRTKAVTLPEGPQGAARAAVAECPGRDAEQGVRRNRAAAADPADPAAPVSPAGPATPATPVTPVTPATPVRKTWFAVVTADRVYFSEVVAGRDPGEVPFEFPGDCAEQRVELTGTQMRIGRRSASRGLRPEIDLSGPPADPGISHLHAVLIAQQDGTWSVLDTGSSNGTQVNGREIDSGEPAPLRDGDSICLGAWTKLTIHVT